ARDAAVGTAPDGAPGDARAADRRERGRAGGPTADRAPSGTNAARARRRRGLPAATAASPAPAPAATAAPPAHPALPVRAKAPAGTRQAARTVAIAEPEAAPFAPEKWS